MLHLVLAQPCVCLIHVADDNRNVLKPPVIATRIERNGSSPWCEVLIEFDGFVAQFHPDNANAYSEHTRKMLHLFTRDLHVRHFLEGEDTRVKVDRSVHIGHGDRDRINAPNCRTGLSSGNNSRGSNDDDQNKTPAISLNSYFA